jgi:hypothetical protein
MAKNPQIRDDNDPMDAEDRFTLLSPAMASYDGDYAGFFTVPEDTIGLLPPMEKPGKRGAR